MRYFFPAESPSRNLTGNLRSRCTVVWLSRPGEHELVGNSETSRITITGRIRDDSPFLCCKHNYPRILDAYPLAIRRSGSVRANVRDSDHFSRRTTGRGIVVVFHVTELQENSLGGFPLKLSGISAWIIDRETERHLGEEVGGGHCRDLGQSEYVSCRFETFSGREDAAEFIVARQRGERCRIPCTGCARESTLEIKLLELWLDRTIIRPQLP